MENNLYALIHIPLKNGYLCIDCEMIGTNTEQCAACGSNVIVRMDKFLNRKTNETIMLGKLPVEEVFAYSI